MKRGDIYWANLSPRSGSEQKGRRPVVVISHDAFNETAGWRSIIIVPVSTSVRQALRGPTVVRLPRGSGSLTKSSVVLCHQVTTIDRSKLARRMGKLSSAAMDEIDEALKAAMDIN